MNSTAREVWELGRGVCQDFSHVALGALRSIGLPARYVSGYLHPRPGEANKTVIGESHSWVEWWCGSWVAYDPTLCRRLTDGYVRIGQGRDYGDVAPLRGTYAGGIVGDVRHRGDDRARIGPGEFAEHICTCTARNNLDRVVSRRGAARNEFTLRKDQGLVAGFLG